MTLGQTLYYYLGSVQDNESGDDVSTDEDDPAALVITFDTSVTTPFTLTIPVTFNASADTAAFNATGVSQLINAGSEGGFLFAQVRLSATQDTTPNPPPTLATSYTYDIDSFDTTRYYYLMLSYDTPEPATYVLIGSALLGLAFLKKRRRRAR